MFGKYYFQLIPILIIALLITQCSLNEVQPNIFVKILTDESIYSMDSATTIEVTVINLSNQPIYYICTCQIQLEELKNNQVINSWMVHGFEECYSSIPIGYSKTDTFIIDLHYLYKEGFLDNAIFNNTTSYRLKLDLFEDKDFNNILEEKERISNYLRIINLLAVEWVSE